MKSHWGNSDGSWDKELLNTEAMAYKGLLVIYYTVWCDSSFRPLPDQWNLPGSKRSVWMRSLEETKKWLFHIWVKMLLNRSRIRGAGTQSQLQPSPPHPGNFSTFWGRLWVTRMYGIKIWAELSWILRAEKTAEFWAKSEELIQNIEIWGTVEKSCLRGEASEEDKGNTLHDLTGPLDDTFRAMWTQLETREGNSEIQMWTVEPLSSLHPCHWFNVNLLHKFAKRRTNTWDCYTWNVLSQSHYIGVGKLWPTGQIQPTAVFVSKMLLEYSHDHSFVYWLLSMAVFLLQQ